ncbi:MAG: amine dehydrogenase large subunit [Steroidobacteraceae bacterium]
MHTFLSRVAFLAVIAALCTSVRLPAAPASSPLPAEHLTVAKIGPRNPHWVYILDEAQNNEIDARVFLFDGDTYRRLGQIDAGFMPGVNLSPDGKTTVVATTYFARGGHGARTDVVEFNDNATFAKTGEIVLPPKHAQTLAMLFTVAYSADGRFVYTPYLTPAASFGVLDPVRKTIIGEIETAGCVLVIPSGPNRVSSICESGRLLTVTLDAHGHEASRASSAPLFDPDHDPIFAQGVPTPDGYAFVSFLGTVHEVDFSKSQPAIQAAWSLVSAEEKGTWRPGGIQIGAVQRATGKLFVPMHRGAEGSHKEGGSQIWEFDLKSHRRVARWPFDNPEAGRIVAVQVTQDAAPLVFGATDRGALAIFDARSGRLKHVEKQVGQTPSLLLNP